MYTSKGICTLILFLQKGHCFPEPFPKLTDWLHIFSRLSPTAAWGKALQGTYKCVKESYLFHGVCLSGGCFCFIFSDSPCHAPANVLLCRCEGSSECFQWGKWLGKTRGKIFSLRAVLILFEIKRVWGVFKDVLHRSPGLSIHVYPEYAVGFARARSPALWNKSVISQLCQ